MRSASASRSPWLVLAIACALPLTAACSTREGTATATATAPLQRLVVSFTDTIPGRGSEAMGLPSPQDSERLARGVRAAQSADLQRAQDLVAPLGYRVRAIVDSATGRRAFVFSEPPGPRAHGWGMFVIAPHPRNQLIVEVPHPDYDIGTPGIGAAAFEQADAAALLVAGTHRYANSDGSSDVAHDSRSMFARLDHALVGRDQKVLQVHGFDSTGRPGRDDVAGVDAVVSAGVSPAPRLVRQVASRLRAAHFRVCAYDGHDCAALGATGNVEGAWCRSVGARFLHLELSRQVRDDRRRWTAAVQAAVAALGAAR